MKKIPIISGGVAGIKVVNSASRLGADVTIYEHNESVGKKKKITLSEDNSDLSTVTTLNESTHDINTNLADLPHYASVNSRYYIGSVTSADVAEIPSATLTSGISLFTVLGVGITAGIGIVIATKSHVGEAILSQTPADSIAPLFTSPATATAINENSGAGQTIYTATSTDTGDIATGLTIYSLKQGSDAGLFTINPTTGDVTLIANPDYEIKSSYGFTVVATDSVGNESEKGVTFAIINLDEVAPTITSAITATAINENSGAGQTIYTATSTDTGDIATGLTIYSLKQGSDAGLFTINPTTGDVTLIANPDYETKSSYGFTVVATDSVGNESNQTLQLSINNVIEINDPMNLYETLIWSESDGWSNGGIFANSWSKDQIVFNQGVMDITLSTIDMQLISGEYRSLDTYGYGFYETSLKASNIQGTINGFFTYTGPSEGTPHHEIDIEIKGDYPSKVQVNYWTDGIEHPTVVDLGFDASQNFHTYAFSWKENQIDWYIDGNIIHTEDGSRGLLPTLPGKIMTNLWATEGAAGWSSDYLPSSGSALLQVDTISYSGYQSVPVI